MAKKSVSFLLAVWMVVVLEEALVASAANVESCKPVKSVYNRQGFDDQVPSQPIPGSHLKTCSSKTTCCTDMMERKLSVESRKDFDTNLKNLLNPMANLLGKKHTKLNELFKKLLNHSRKSFDDLFSDTYGEIYKMNSYIFMDLYDNLRKYYDDGESSIEEIMNNFFKIFNRRMFAVFNNQYNPSPKYLDCASSHLDELQPFGDVPKKLTIQIKRSFVAFRTFVQGLATGRDVVRNVLKENLSKSCVHELMRMTHCSTCDGHVSVHPCLAYCKDVIHVCLAHHQPLIQHWMSFVDAMVDVGERLENPFNIENVIEPVNYKLSIAVMNFQESGTEINNKVEQGCGELKVGRSKRQAARGELAQEFLEFKRRDPQPYESREMGVGVTPFIHEVKTKVKNSRNFWGDLSVKMCKHAHQEASSCWTGTKLGRYESEAGLNVSVPQHSSEMDVQIMRLKVITSKLREAYNGRDVSWIDDEWLGNGQQDGSGIGDTTTYSKPAKPPKDHYPPDDEDAYDQPDSYAGSGYGPHSYDDTYSENDKEGSGSEEYGSGWGETPYKKHKIEHNKKAVHPPSPYDPVHPPPRKPPKYDNSDSGVIIQPPSAAAKESMSLYRAVSIYLLPAFIMFLGSLA